MALNLARESVSAPRLKPLAIDEEIGSMIKMFEADMKRLKGILVTYEEKVKDLSAHELEQRNQVLDMLK